MIYSFDWKTLAKKFDINECFKIHLILLSFEDERIMPYVTSCIF